MPRAGPPLWRRRKEPILDHLWLASIEQTNGIPDQQGHYGELIYTGIETKTRAEEIKRALYRCRRYVNGGISGYVKVEKDGAGYRVRYKAIDKTMARKYMLDHYGDDPSKWPYSARPGRPNYHTEIFKEEP